MVYALALAASLVNALTSVLQRLGVQNAPADATLRLSLLTHALRRRVWLLGFALMIVSFVLQAIALHVGRLSEVQPILTTELVFLTAILAIWFRFTVGSREWIGAIAVAGGLSGFLYFARPRYGMTQPPGWRWGVAGGVCVGIIAVAVFLTQNAIHAGPLVASQSTLVLVDPLASICIGIGLFGDDLHTGGAAGPLEALSLLVAFGGAVWLARSPLISAMNEGERLELRPRRSRSAA